MATEVQHSFGGTDRLALIAVASRDLDYVTGVTVGGVPATKVSEDFQKNLAGVQVWALKNPAVGTQPVVVALSDYKLVSLVVQGVRNVDQDTPVEAAGHSSGNSNATAVAVATISGDAVVWDAINLRDANAATVGSGQTEIANSDSPDVNLGRLLVSRRAVGTPATVTEAWTLGTDVVAQNVWSAAAVAIRKKIFVIPAQPAFDITAVPGALAYYKRDAYDASTGTWTDAVAGRNAVRYTVANRPAANSTVGGATFASGQNLPAPGLSASTDDVSVFAVLTVPDISGGNKTVLGASGDGGIQMRVETSGYIAFNRQGVSLKVASPNPLVAGQKTLVEFVIRRSSTLKNKAGFNGALVETGDPNNDAFTAGRTALIGAGYFGENFVGSIHSLFATAGEPDADTLAKIEGRLAWDHELQALLSSGHPYKAAPPPS